MNTVFHLFENNAEYQNYVETNYSEPFVGAIQTGEDEYEVKYNSTYYKYVKEPLTFRIQSDGKIFWGILSEGSGNTIEFKKNDGEWSSITGTMIETYSSQITIDGKSGTYIYGGFDLEEDAFYWENGSDKVFGAYNYLDVGMTVFDYENEYEVLSSQYETNGSFIPVVSGDIIQFKGDNPTYGYDDMYHFESSCGFNIEGNIMSLINSTGFTTATTLLSSDTFNGLFYGCSNLTDVSKLILPATTLAEYCYSSMFYNCTSLTSAPELPATTLANNCYYHMFYGCTSLTTAPELPATTLANGCYGYMFNGCTSLTSAPELPATTLANYCYQYMFWGCTSLTNAPELPATTLATSCYYYMFQDCTSLTSAPILPATTLANYCYNSMFYGCTNLNYIKCLATDISATNCTRRWVYNVQSNGTFIKNPNMTSWTTGVNGIPTNWTVQDAS